MNTKVLMSGARGLVGTHMREVFFHMGWDVVSLTRDVSAKGFVHWDPTSKTTDTDALEGCDYVIHLAGESVASGRWNEERKRLILESRETVTRLLSETLAGLKTPPRVMICASGSHIYKDNAGGPPWDESGLIGDGFLPEVCVRWEAASAPARNAGIRVVHARMGSVMSIKGGLLTRLLPAISSGLGGAIGEGNQRLSWIHVEDLGRAFLLLLQNPSLEGAVNVVSPKTVTNAELTDAIAKVIHRPTFVGMPRSAIMWLYGEMGAELMLSDNAVFPAKLVKAGMEWKFANIENALTDLLAEHHALTSQK